VSIEGGKITRQGVENNIDVALRYIDSWLLGNGAAAINNLMEDAATAEISRAQLWQWLRHLAKMDDGTAVTPYLYSKIKSELVAKLPTPENKIELAGEILDALVLSDVFEDFLTVKAYPYLDNTLV
jgi:Malate synthase